MSNSDLDEYSDSWQLESTYPIARGASSAIASLTLISLWIATLYKVYKRHKEDPDYKPEICKHYGICCDGYSDCKDLFVMPAPLDLCLCIFCLGFLTFSCKAYGDFYYKDWRTAQQELIGSIVLIVFAVCGGLIALTIYMYYYSILILTVNATGSAYAIPKFTQKVHQLFMIIGMLTFPTGQLMMEVFDSDFGYIFRIGQGLAYCAVAVIVCGMFHLTILLVKRLERVLVNSTVNEMKSVDAYEMHEREHGHLIQFMTKMLVIVIVILLISFSTAVFTGIRYIFPSPEISLARWFWFSLINMGFGAFCVYLTIGFNIELYKWWCRCDHIAHKCVLCCVKFQTIRRFTQSLKMRAKSINISGSIKSQSTITASSNTQIARTSIKSIPSHSPHPDPQELTIAPGIDSRMTSYSSIDHPQQQQHQKHKHDGIPVTTQIEQKEEDIVYDLPFNVTKVIEMQNRVDKFNNDIGNDESESSERGYLPGIQHMASVAL